MKIKKLTYLDFIKEIILFSITFSAFYFDVEGIGRVLYWLLWMIAILSYLAALGCSDIGYTRAKANFESYTILLFCSGLTYFEFYILASVLLFGTLSLIGVCYCNYKETE